MQELPGAEGETYKGLLFFPKRTTCGSRSPSRKANRSASPASHCATVPDEQMERQWHHDRIKPCRRAEGERQGVPVAGFEWDYGGFVPDWKGDALGRPMRAAHPDDPLRPGSPLRRNRCWATASKVASDNATLVKWAPVVTEIGVTFADVSIRGRISRRRNPPYDVPSRILGSNKPISKNWCAPIFAIPIRSLRTKWSPTADPKSAAFVFHDSPPMKRRPEGRLSACPQLASSIALHNRNSGRQACVLRFGRRRTMQGEPLPCRP